MLSELARTEHDLDANGRNTIDNDMDESGTWCNDSRTRKLVNMKNSTVVCLIACVRRRQLNISLTHVLKCYNADENGTFYWT